MGAARVVDRNSTRSFTRYVSQLLSIRHALAVYRHQAGIAVTSVSTLIPATPSARIREEVLAGLRADQKTLSPKFFYDKRGADLFEEICELPEYYLTRSELAILRARSREIAQLAGPGCSVIEYGSGAGIKARLVLDALENPVAYVPVDISRTQLIEVARDMSADYPELAVRPVCADYTARFDLPDIPGELRRLAFFPGSTIGNFHPHEAVEFLRRIRDLVGPNGAMVLGVDRVKDKAVLDAAYNDSAGLTAEFNLNILRRLNDDVRAEFDLDAFEHVAFFNASAGRIEMHLRSLRQQIVCVAGEAIHFDEGETIWTESSYKYSRETLDALLEASGLRIERLWTDSTERFWVAYLTS